MTTSSLGEQSALASRIRSILTARPVAIREVRMFGGLSFMVDDAMAVSASRDGNLLIRIDPSRYQELLDAGGEPALMGPARPMGRGWLTVAGSQVAVDADLTRWVDIGIDARNSRS